MSRAGPSSSASAGPSTSSLAPRPHMRAAYVDGPIGASYTVFESPWTCGDCGGDNFPRRDRCFKCKAPRPAGSVSVGVPPGVVGPSADDHDGGGGAGLSSSSPPSHTPWREAYDPKSRQIYYYNTLTFETAWARPLEMGAAPYASGRFGRGAAGVDADAALVAKNREWLRRPARKQSDLDPSRLQVAEGSNEYNIWFGRYTGDAWRGSGVLGPRDPAPTRCHPETDAGWTKPLRGGVDGGGGGGAGASAASSSSSSSASPDPAAGPAGPAVSSLGDHAFFCLHFARGACWRGHDCTYHHHVPTAADDAAAEPTRDIFGRDRHQGHRSDMGGVGSITDDCRTLYVGGLRRGATGGGDKDKDPPSLEDLVRTHFSVWGELESVNIVPRISVAFVRYRLRSNAEFARAAMANQNLGGSEILNVRWAYEDPNPVAQASRDRADADVVAAALAARGIDVDAALLAASATGSSAGGGAGGMGGGNVTVNVGGVEMPLHVALTGVRGPPAQESLLQIGDGRAAGSDATAGAGEGFAGADDVAAFLHGAAAASSSVLTTTLSLAEMQRQNPDPHAGPPQAPPPPPLDQNTPAYAEWYYARYMPYAQAMAAYEHGRAAAAAAGTAQRGAATGAGAKRGSATSARGGPGWEGERPTAAEAAYDEDGWGEEEAGEGGGEEAHEDLSSSSQPPSKRTRAVEEPAPS
jgi:hypothetical protein